MQGVNSEQKVEPQRVQHNQRVLREFTLITNILSFIFLNNSLSQANFLLKIAELSGGVSVPELTFVRFTTDST